MCTTGSPAGAMREQADVVVVGAGAAGAVAAKVTAKYDGCLQAGSTVRVVLEEPVSIAIRG